MFLHNAGPLRNHALVLFQLLPNVLQNHIPNISASRQHIHSRFERGLTSNFSCVCACVVPASFFRKSSTLWRCRSTDFVNSLKRASSSFMALSSATVSARAAFAASSSSVTWANCSSCMRTEALEEREPPSKVPAGSKESPSRVTVLWVGDGEQHTAARLERRMIEGKAKHLRHADVLVEGNLPGCLRGFCNEGAAKHILHGGRHFLWVPHQRDGWLHHISTNKALGRTDFVVGDEAAFDLRERRKEGMRNTAVLYQQPLSFFPPYSME